MLVWGPGCGWPASSEGENQTKQLVSLSLGHMASLPAWFSGAALAGGGASSCPAALARSSVPGIL